MEAARRRQSILARLEGATSPVPAAALGEELGVSRQIVVGDVALLRASGHAVRATNRGYLLARPSALPRRSLAVQHDRDGVEPELRAILAAGARVLDVSVMHRLYGQLTVDLLIRDEADLEDFLDRLPESSTLSELTNGWHRHTLEADTVAQLDDAARRLDALGFLRPDE